MSFEHGDIHSSLHKLDLVTVEDRQKGGDFQIKRSNVEAFDHSHAYRYHNPNNLPATTFTGNSEVNIDLQSGRKLKRVFLLRKITVAGNTVEIVPVEYSFERIEVWAEKGAGQLLETIWPDAAYIQDALLCNDPVYKELYRKSGSFDPENNYKEGPVLHVGTHIQMIPFPSNFLMQHEPHLAQQLNDLRVKFYCRDIKASGAGTLTCNEFSLISEELVSSDEDSKLVDSLHANHQIRSNFVTAQVLSVNNKAFTASGSVDIDISPIAKSKCLGIAMAIRASTGVTNHACLRPIRLGGPKGGDTLIDLLNGDSSLVNYGKALTSFQYEQLATLMTHSDFWSKSGWSFLPLGDIQAALGDGKIDGYLQLDNSTDVVRLTFPAAGTASITTITLTNAANDAGSCNIAVVDKSSGKVLGISADIAFDATVGVIKSTIEAIPVLQAGGWTVTASNTFAAGTSVVLTMGQAKYFPYEFRCLVGSLNDGGVGDEVTVSESTVGLDGWTTIASGSATLTLIFFSVSQAAETVSGKYELMAD